ncbi:MAG: hypothetical protein QOH93_1411, partial [Chloroflexia bacterium]|nr:hypothetical protein [Chloroflexia bacterium]
IPLRFPQVEALLTGQEVARIDRDAVADALVADATPLSKNGYKVPLLKGLFRQALQEILG